MRPLILAVACLSVPLVASGQEWIELFNGRDLNGWMAKNEGEPGKGWQVEDGVLHRAAGGGDLVSEREFDDYELEFEWRISAKGNSGVKYRVRKSPQGWLGAEYQVIDDGGHADSKDADRSAAALYDLVAPADDKPLEAQGEWNRARVVVQGAKIEHWLNGEKVLEVDTGSDAWKEAKAASKFSRVEGFAEAGPGRILLQDHGNEVWFRAIRLKPL